MPIIRDLNKEREQSFLWCCANYKNICITTSVILIVYLVMPPLLDVGYNGLEAPIDAQVQEIKTHMGAHEMMINGTMCMPPQPQIPPYIFEQMTTFDPCSQPSLSASCCPQSMCDASRFLTCKKSDTDDNEEVCKYAGMACYTSAEYSVIHKNVGSDNDGGDDNDDDFLSLDDWPIIMFVIVVFFAICNNKKVDNTIKTAAKNVRSWWDSRYKDSGGNSTYNGDKDYVHTYQMVDFDDFATPARNSRSSDRSSDGQQNLSVQCCLS